MHDAPEHAADSTSPSPSSRCARFPRIRDLVTDVSWNFRVKKKIKKFKPRKPDAPDGTWRMQQEDVDRVQEFRKCIECFLCQDVCHVLRDHHKHDEFIGPRFLVYTAALEMHPLDTEDRLPELKQAHGIGYCNITKCCTKVCPENITITDNAIIPLKERVVDEFYDPLGWLWKKMRPKGLNTPHLLRTQPFGVSLRIGAVQEWTTIQPSTPALGFHRRHQVFFGQHPIFQRQRMLRQFVAIQAIRMFAHHALVTPGVNGLGCSSSFRHFNFRFHNLNISLAVYFASGTKFSFVMGIGRRFGRTGMPNRTSDSANVKPR